MSHPAHFLLLELKSKLGHDGDSADPDQSALVLTENPESSFDGCHGGVVITVGRVADIGEC